MADAPAARARSAAEAAEARAYGLTQADLSEWGVVRPDRDLLGGQARRYPEEITPWSGAGFAPFDAVEAKETGVPLETAVAWLQAGFILPDAALLIRDGWTLEEAVAARYAGIAAEHWSPA